MKNLYLSIQPKLTFSKFPVLCVLLAGILSLTTQAFSTATVAPGFSLFETGPGSLFFGYEFEGVPIEEFDFDDTDGDDDLVDTGSTDTIIKRIDPATGDDGDTVSIDIEMVALSLKSVSPIDLAPIINPGQLHTYFITLQEAHKSMGTLDITFTDSLQGVFSSVINVFFDIRIGAIDGTIVGSDSIVLSSTNTPWSRTPIPGSVQLSDVNLNLNGSNSTEDFWIEEVTLTGTGAQHSVVPAKVPDTSNSIILLAFGLIGIVGFRARRR